MHSLLMLVQIRAGGRGKITHITSIPESFVRDLFVTLELILRVADILA